MLSRARLIQLFVILRTWCANSILDLPRLSGVGGLASVIKISYVQNILYFSNIFNFALKSLTAILIACYSNFKNVCPKCPSAYFKDNVNAYVQLLESSDLVVMQANAGAAAYK